MSTFSLCFPHIPHSRMVMMSLRSKQLQSLVYFYEYHSKHIFLILCMILPSKTIPDSAKRHKNPTRCGGTYLPCGTKFLRVLIFAFFAVFPAIRKNKFPQIKITANIFPAKIYSRVNTLWLKFATRKYSTKESCLFNHNLSLSFRNNEILVYCLKICISIVRTQ